MALRRILNTRHYKLITPIDTPGIYHNSDLGLISLSSDGSNWITIADKNLGATQVYNYGDTLSEANAGKFYQWGNNYGFNFSGAVTTSSFQVNAQNYGPGNYYNVNSFITRNSSPYNWDSSNNNNLRGGVTGTVEAMQGPCVNGFHIPTLTELTNLVNMGGNLSSWDISTGGVNFCTLLKIGFTGARRISDGAAVSQGVFARLWTTSVNSTYSSYYDIWENQITLTSQGARGLGLSIRPFANTPTQPDDSRTKLY